MADRRQILASTAAVAALAMMGSSETDPAAAAEGDSALDAALQSRAKAMLQALPEMATRLCLDVGAQAELRSRLDYRQAMEPGLSSRRRMVAVAVARVQPADPRLRRWRCAPSGG